MLTKQRFLEIFYTALMGACIAFLQSFVTALVDTTPIMADPTVAAGAGGLLRAVFISKFRA